MNSSGPSRALKALLVVLAPLVYFGPGATARAEATYSYDEPSVARADVREFNGFDRDDAQRNAAVAGSASRPVGSRGTSTASSTTCVATKSGNAHGLGVSDPPSRISGPWTEDDLARGAMGKPPKSLGSPELHHADQMPGAGIHEVDAVTHRLPGNHPNMFNQGVTDAMRTSDRQLHWWYRAQEMGGRDVLGSGAFYD